MPRKVINGVIISPKPLKNIRLGEYYFEFGRETGFMVVRSITIIKEFRDGKFNKQTYINFFKVDSQVVRKIRQEIFKSRYTLYPFKKLDGE